MPLETPTDDFETGKPTPELAQNRLTARRIWIAFLFTFVAARLPVLLIMERVTFFYLPTRSLQHAKRIMFPKLERIEQPGPR